MKRKFKILDLTTYLEKMEELGAKVQFVELAPNTFGITQAPALGMPQWSEPIYIVTEVAEAILGGK